MWITRLFQASTTTLTPALLLLAAENPFTGNWKRNPTNRRRHRRPLTPSGKWPHPVMSQWWLPVLLAVALGSVSASALKADSQIVRTLVYHQISSFTTTTLINTGGQPGPILSGNGQRIAFTNSMSGDFINNHISAINPDGSGQTEVDSYPPLCGCYSMIDISADGSKVISSDAVQLRIANGDGSRALPLIALNSNEINAIAISGDGGKVFFRVYRDTSIRGSDPAIPIERGVWVINADGSGRQQIVSPAQMEALGLPPTGFFGSAGPVLASSTDGSQIVFGAFNDPQAGGFGNGLFGVHLDGTGLHDFLGRVGFLLHGGISSDGRKVFYNLTPVAAGHGEIGVINFDGTGRLPLADNSTLPFPASDDRVQLSADGSRLLLGSTGVLLNTDGSGMLQLAIVGHELDALLYNGLFRATMNSSATRFLYFALPFGQPPQLATLEINPNSLGAAPSITSPAIAPSFVLTRGRSAATVSARVAASNPLLSVGNTVLQKGLDDPNVFHQVMLDAGDGTFTNTSVATNCCAGAGARTVRVQSGVRAADNKLHATAVEIGPFAVLEDLAQQR
jgi:hypothetical protein